MRSCESALNDSTPIQRAWIRGFLLIGLACLLWWPAVKGTFRDDDAHIMLIALRHHPLSFVQEPTAYQELSTAHYTPWVLWSYASDLLLAGDVAYVTFLAHQTVSQLCLIILSLIVAARLAPKEVSCIAGFLAALLLLSDRSLGATVQQFYTRHYLEGLSLCLVALLAVRHYWVSGRLWSYWLGLLAFAAALLAKEVFLALPGCFLFFARAPDRRAVSGFSAECEHLSDRDRRSSLHFKLGT